MLLRIQAKLRSAGIAEELKSNVIELGHELVAVELEYTDTESERKPKLFDKTYGSGLAERVTTV